MSWLDECEAAACALPVEKHQEFLDLVRRGKTLGEAREAAGISFDAANGIMRRNIEERLFLRSSARELPMQEPVRVGTLMEKIVKDAKAAMERREASDA